MADPDACFDDDSSLETFFMFGESKTIREFMIAGGTFSKLIKDFQKRLKEDFLIVTGYDKGVAIGGEDFYTRADNSWVFSLPHDKVVTRRSGIPEIPSRHERIHDICCFA